MALFVKEHLNEEEISLTSQVGLKLHDLESMGLTKDLILGEGVDEYVPHKPEIRHLKEQILLYRLQFGGEDILERHLGVIGTD